MAALRKRPRGAARGGRRSVLVRLLPVEVEAIDRVRGGVDRNEWMRLVCARAVEAAGEVTAVGAEGLPLSPITPERSEAFNRPALPRLSAAGVEAEALPGGEVVVWRVPGDPVNGVREGRACPEHPWSGVAQVGGVAFCAEPGCPRRL